MRARTLLRAGGMLILALALATPAVADDDAAELAKKIQKKIEKALKKAQEEAEDAAKDAQEAREDAAEEAREDAQEAREKAERKARKDARKESADKAEEAREEAREEGRAARQKSERTARKDARDQARDKLTASTDLADKGQGKALRKFRKEAREYAELHAKLEEKLSKLKADAPATVTDHERALGAAIRLKRDDARQGDVFVPESQPFFKQVLKEEMAGPEGKPARRAAREGNPPLEPGSPPVKVAVNAPYPLAAPVSTVPPSVLLHFPTLPQELEYRFVGRDLVLRDTTANLIVDFIPEAAPPLTAR